MAEYLKGCTGVDALHVLSHGEAGNLRLGDAAITETNLVDHADILRTIGTALSDDGDILLYACDLAGGDGVELVGRLAEATGADIAASTDTTGTAEQGGYWVLEATTGPVEARALALDGYGGVLGDAAAVAATVIRGHAVRTGWSGC